MLAKHLLTFMGSGKNLSRKTRVSVNADVNVEHGLRGLPHTSLSIGCTPKHRRHILLALCALTVVVILGMSSHSIVSGTPIFSLQQPQPQYRAQIQIAALFATQPHTLSSARALYSLKNKNRPPPPHFSAWFNYTQEHKCLVDVYSQVYEDFAPFYEMEEMEPGWFKNRVERLTGGMYPALKVVDIKDGHVTMDGPEMWMDGPWIRILNRFATHLPNIRFILNMRDEPRVVFNYRSLGASDRAHNDREEYPFFLHPPNTADFFRNQGCIKASVPTGFFSSANDDTAFLMSSANSEFTTDFYPLLSQTRMASCFADIMVPSPYHYQSEGLSPLYRFPDNITWAAKKSQLYWRGSGTGGKITTSSTSYRHFPRFHLLSLARTNPDLMDVALTALPETNCRRGPCSPETIIKEYNITHHREPREDGYGFKYASDLDGNSFSGRFLGLMRSGSLVFKATVFDEFWTDWFRPYEHFIPVRPDLSDLVARIEWAKANDDEARRIQEAGQAMTEALGTDVQNDCYFFAVLLEWARLQGGTGEGEWRGG